MKERHWSQWIIYSLDCIVIPLAFTLTFAFIKKIKEYGSSIQRIVKLIIGANLIFFVIQIPILIIDYNYHRDYDV